MYVFCMYMCYHPCDILNLVFVCVLSSMWYIKLGFCMCAIVHVIFWTWFLYVCYRPCDILNLVFVCLLSSMWYFKLVCYCWFCILLIDCLFWNNNNTVIILFARFVVMVLPTMSYPRHWTATSTLNGKCPIRPVIMRLQDFLFAIAISVNPKSCSLFWCFPFVLWIPRFIGGLLDIILSI